MKRHGILILIGWAVGLFGCNPTTNNQVKSTEQLVPSKRSSGTNAQLVGNENQPKQGIDCGRGQAEPVIQKAHFPNTTFILQPDSITAIETVTFNNGDKLIIRHWGCEYYVLTLCFETARFNADTTALKFWYITTVKLLNEVKYGIDAPIDIDKGTKALNKYISLHTFDLALQQEIDFGSNDLRSFVTFDRIEKIDDKKFGVMVSFATGPL